MLLTCLYAVAPQPVSAPTRFSAQAGAEIDEALVALDSMQYKLVIERLYKAKGPYSLDDLIRRDETLGIALALSHREKEAFEVFKHLLALAPGFDLPYTLPPQVTIIFERARSVLAKRNSTRVDLQVARDASLGQEIPVALFCRGNALDLVANWELCFRRRGANQPYSCLRQVSKGADSRNDFILPVLVENAESDTQNAAKSNTRTWMVLQIALSGYDAQGNEVYRYADRDLPREFEVGLHPSPPWYAPPWQRKAWFWVTLAGLGLAGVGLTVAILNAPGDTMTLGAEVLP